MTGHPNGAVPSQRLQVDDDDAQPRQQPCDVPAEQAVLGGMLLSKAACAEIFTFLHGDDFYRPVHQRIFDTMVRLYGLGQPVDAVTVGTALDEAGDLSRIGGAPYLLTLIESVPTAANAGYYGRTVADRAVERRLIEAGARIMQLGYRGAEGVGRSTAELATLAQQAVYEVTAREATEDYKVLADMLQETLDAIEAIGKRGDGMTGVPTGFIDLDRLLNGLSAGQFVIIGGRPGLGKSTLGADIARNVAIRAGQGAAIFSLEMSKVELVMRILSAESRVPLHVLRSGNLADDDWTRLARRMGEISEAPLFVDDTPNMTLMQLRAKAQRLKQRHDIKLLVVDYLQLMSTSKRGESRQQEVAELSRGLKLLAKELELPVIGVCQLNRGSEQRQNKRPQLSDLRESGSLEQDADIVILLHRDDYYDKESVRAGECDFDVAKHRNGPTDTVTVAAQLHFSRFVDMSLPEGS